MLLTFETTTGKLLVSPYTQVPLDVLEAKRGDGEHIALALLRDGVLWQAPGGTQMVFAVKAHGVYSGDALASAETWVYDPSSGRYDAAINYNVTGLNQLLLIGQTPENDRVHLHAEFAWLRPSLGGSWRRSQTVDFVLHNNVWRGTENSTPLPATSLLRPVVTAISSNVVNNNATANTLQDVTGLAFPVLAGRRYGFRFVIPYNASATGNGSRWSINGPAASLISYRSTYVNSSGGGEIAPNYLTAYDLPAAHSGNSMTTGNIAIIEGLVSPSANGEIVARFASELAGGASITALAGAHVMHWEM
jgi:hypothetical protein